MKKIIFFLSAIILTLNINAQSTLLLGKAGGTGFANTGKTLKFGDTIQSISAGYTHKLIFPASTKNYWVPDTSDRFALLHHTIPLAGTKSGYPLKGVIQWTPAADGQTTIGSTSSYGMTFGVGNNLDLVNSATDFNWLQFDRGNSVVELRTVDITTSNKGTGYIGVYGNQIQIVSQSGLTPFDNNAFYFEPASRQIRLYGTGSFKGIVENTDYSANYVPLSLINKSYANSTFAPITGGAYLSSTLNAGKIYVGNGSNVGTAVTPSLSATPGTYSWSTTGAVTFPDAATGMRGLLNSTDWNIFNNKQPAIGFTPENVVNKATDLTSNDNTHYPTTAAVQTAINSAVTGQDYKEACKYATTAALPTVIYSNGSSGVGATLTGAAVGAISIDGSSPVVGNRLLVKNQVSTFQNGIYTITATGSGIAVFVLTRTSDFDQASEILTGDATFVTSGSTQSATTWVINSDDNPVLGTDAITFVQTSGQGSLSAGTGINITGTTISTSAIPNASLTNSSTTINGTTISLGASGTVTAAAGTLTGTTINSTVVSSSLTSAGTFTTGTWNAGIITGTYGGSGVNNGSTTFTRGGNVTYSGAYPFTGTLTSTTTVTYPTSGTLYGTQSGSITSANLTTSLTDEMGTGAIVCATSPTLTTAELGSSTATTQAAMDNSTKVSTTAYVDKTRFIPIGAQTTTLSNGSGYVFGTKASAFRTGFQTCAVGVPYTGTITRIQLTTCSTAGGASGQSMRLYLNNSNWGTVTSSFDTSSGIHVLNITGLSISVTAGDYIELNFTSGASTTSCNIDGNMFYAQ